MNKDISYAYVRFVDDDKFEVVSTSKILKFDKYNINYNLKYKVEWKDGNHYLANIIYFKDTLEELNKLITQKRVKLTPKTFLLSQSDDSESEIEGSRKRIIKSRPLNQFKPLEQSILKEYSLPSRVSPVDSSPKKKDKGCQTESLDSKEIKLLQKEIEDIRRLNINLQEIVINKFNDGTNLTNGIPAETIKPSVGEMVPGTEDIYIGHNITVTKTAFNDCVNQKTSSLFVRMLVVYVFGIEALKNSSVTGKSSNRTKGPSKPKLDPTKMAAIYDAHKYFLEKKGTDDFKLLSELAKTSQYITAKINDMNRLLRGKTAPHTNGDIDKAHEENITIREEDL